MACRKRERSSRRRSRSVRCVSEARNKVGGPLWWYSPIHSIDASNGNNDIFDVPKLVFRMGEKEAVLYLCPLFINQLDPPHSSRPKLHTCPLQHIRLRSSFGCQTFPQQPHHHVLDLLECYIGPHWRMQPTISPVHVLGSKLKRGQRGIAEPGCHLGLAYGSRTRHLPSGGALLPAAYDVVMVQLGVGGLNSRPSPPLIDSQWPPLPPLARRACQVHHVRPNHLPTQLLWTISDDQNVLSLASQ